MITLDDRVEPHPSVAPTCGHADGFGHDCAYVEARNRLLAAAARLASQEIGFEPRVDSVHRTAWGSALLRHMAALWNATK